jgi:WD40 repeat protein
MSHLQNALSLVACGTVLVVCGTHLRGEDPKPPTQEVFNFESPDGRVGAVVFSPDGKKLLIATRRLDLLEVATGKLTGAKFDHPGSAGISGAAFSPDGKWVVTASSGLVKLEPTGFVTLFDAATGKQLADRECHGKTANAVAFTPDGKVLVTGGEDGRLRLWEPGQLKEKAALEGHDSAVLSLAVSPDGKLLATADREGSIRLWDLPAGKHRATLRGHRDRVPFKDQAALVRAVAFSPDGRLLVSGDYWGHVAVWDVAKEKATAEFGVPHPTLPAPNLGTVHSVAFTPDGKAVAIGCESAVRFWTPDGKTELGAAKGHANGVYRIAFGSGGRMATGDDFRAYLWAAPKPKP